MWIEEDLLTLQTQRKGNAVRIGNSTRCCKGQTSRPLSRNRTFCPQGRYGVGHGLRGSGISGKAVNHAGDDDNAPHDVIAALLTAVRRRGAGRPESEDLPSPHMSIECLRELELIDYQSPPGGDAVATLGAIASFPHRALEMISA